MITKESFSSMTNYTEMVDNGDFSQIGVFHTESAIRINTTESKCRYLYFTASDDWVLSTFTICVWVYCTRFDYSSLMNLSKTFSKCSTSLEVGTPYMQGYDVGAYIRATKSYPLNTWTHLAFVRDSNKNHYIFINGELSNTPANFNQSDAYEDWHNNIIYIGWDGSQSNAYFYGLIDDLVVTKEVLYTSDFTVPDRPMHTLYPNTTFLLDLYTKEHQLQKSNILKVY